jgi:hypothetical protein
MEAGSCPDKDGDAVLPRDFSAKYLLRNVLAIDKTTGPRRNAKIPFTTKPGTRIEANQKQNPLTTRAKNPRVNSVTGKDRMLRIGLMKELTTPMTTAATIAAGKFAKSTPGNKISTMSSESAVAKVVNKNPSIVNLPL